MKLNTCIGLNELIDFLVEKTSLSYDEVEETLIDCHLYEGPLWLGLTGYNSENEIFNPLKDFMRDNNLTSVLVYDDH